MMSSKLLARRASFNHFIALQSTGNKVCNRSLQSCNPSRTIKKSLETNYLIAGAGANGMLFLEGLINGTEDKTAIIVDKRDGVGGHWRDSYDFVALQCSTSGYGMNGAKLAPDGPVLPTKYQVLEHFERGIDRLEATGRVKFLSQVEYLGEVEGSHKLKSVLASGVEYQVSVTDKLVDATRTENHVPATRPPLYKVVNSSNFWTRLRNMWSKQQQHDVTVIPVNGLARPPPGPWSQFYVVGAGKTGLDAVIYLVKQGVAPENIFLVVAPDCWYHNRSEPDKKVLTDVFSDPNLKDIKSHLHELEKGGFLLRLSPDVEPEGLKGAIISEDQLKILRSVNVVRKGMIKSIENGLIHFNSGESLTTKPSSLFVDCSSLSTLFDPSVQIYEDKCINLQFLNVTQNPRLSAPYIAALEIKYPDDPEKKNTILKPIDIPHTPHDYMKAILGDMENNENIDKELVNWIPRPPNYFPVRHYAWKLANSTDEQEQKQVRLMKQKLRMLIESEQKMKTTVAVEQIDGVQQMKLNLRRRFESSMVKGSSQKIMNMS